MAVLPRLIVASLAVTLLVLVVAPAPVRAEETAAPAADSIEALLVRWQAKPDSVGRGIRLQDAYVRADKQRAALALFRETYKASPDDLVLTFLYGRIKSDRAGIKMMRSALAANLGRADGDTAGLVRAWTALAVAEVDAGNGAEAEKAATRLSAMRGLPEDWTYLGWIQESLLRAPDRAQASYARAIRIKPDHLRARTALAMIHADAGELEEALGLVQGSAEKHPDSADAQLHYGLILAMAGKQPEASKAYGKALACAGENADALASIASAYLDIEEQDLALEAVQKALAIDPDHAEALSNAGLLAMERGDAKAAAKHLKHAAKLQPKHAHTHYLQGICAQRLKKYSVAINHLRKAMSLAPDSIEYVTALARAQAESGAYPAAVAMFKRAIKMAPKDADLQRQLGMAYLKHRKYKLAAKAFDEAVELAPADPRPRYYQAIVYGDKLGKAKEALAALRAYKGLGGKEPSALAWLDELLAALGEE